ncbi:MAG: glycosyltransferase, partial [Clostridia bacterium]|nr:glycosyltransferase [Clostridia bacterium]
QAERFYAIPEIVYIYREGASNALWTEQKVLDRLEGIRDELNTTREAKLEQLHGRVVQRIRNTLRAIQTETDLAEDERIKQAFLRIYREIDKDAVFEYCTADELEYLQMYLEDQLASEDQMEGIISVKRGKACQNYTYIPKVSIIVPVYNVDLYLRECMNSLVHQTLYEIEIICVNDESPDSSHEILEEYFQKDDRITIISQKNKGLSGARNTGMMFAQGEYIHFIDSDDYLSLDAMEKLYAVCKARNLDAVYFDYTRFYDNGTAAPQLVRREHCDIYDGVSFLKTLKDENAFTPTAWSQMLRREFLRENNIAFYQGIIHEDNLFTFYVLMEAKRVSHVGEKLYHHRLRANSIMTVPQSHKNAIGYFISMQEMMLYGLENKRSRTKEAEILRAFDSMRKNTSYVLAKLSHQEKEKIQFQNPFSQLLFDMFFMQDGQAAVQTTVVADSAGKNGSSSRSAQEREMKILKAEIHRLELEIRSIHLSATYRIGRFFTWIPRKVRGGIRCYREHGLGYTLNRVLVHLHLAEDTYTADNERKNITASGEKTTAKEIVRDADYYKKLPAEKYEEELKIWYKRITKRELNLTNPKTFNEKIQWLKLYDTTPLKTMLAD